jgi:GntR family transcriptional regulator
VPPYQQIVQQVRQALRMGVLSVGDQLPSVREVVAVTAVNPKGTFARGRPPGPPPGTHARLGRTLAAWVREARAAGLDDEAIASLLQVTLQAAAEEDIA